MGVFDVLVSVVGVVLVVLGVFVLWGLGWGLVAGGVGVLLLQFGLVEGG